MIGQLNFQSKLVMDWKFGCPIINTYSFKSIHTNHNIAWHVKAYSLISKTPFPIISRMICPKFESCAMERKFWRHLKMFSLTTIIQLFTDQSELSPRPKGCKMHWSRLSVTCTYLHMENLQCEMNRPWSCKRFFLRIDLWLSRKWLTGTRFLIINHISEELNPDQYKVSPLTLWLSWQPFQIVINKKRNTDWWVRKRLDFHKQHLWWYLFCFLLIPGTCRSFFSFRVDQFDNWKYIEVY